MSIVALFQNGGVEVTISRGPNKVLNKFKLVECPAEAKSNTLRKVTYWQNTSLKAMYKLLAA